MMICKYDMSTLKKRNLYAYAYINIYCMLLLHKISKIYQHYQIQKNYLSVNCEVNIEVIPKFLIDNFSLR